MAADQSDDNVVAEAVVSPYAPPFAEISTRHAFICKVSLILMSTCLIAACISCIFLFVHPVKDVVHRYWWLTLIAMAVYLGSMTVIYCLRSTAARRRCPGNLVALVLVTLAESLLGGTLTSSLDTPGVIIAFAITAAVCSAVSVFTYIQVRVDFTLRNGLRFASAVCLLLFGLALLVVCIVYGFHYRPMLDCILGCVGALLLSLVRVSGMLMALRSRSSQLTADQYINGALAVQVDLAFCCNVD